MGRCSIRSKQFKQRLKERFYDQKNLIVLEKELEYKNKKINEEKKKFQETINSLKFDWRSDLFPQEKEEQVEINEEVKVKVPEKLKSNWREEIQKVDEKVIVVDEIEDSSVVDRELCEVKPFIKNKNISPEVYERWYQSSNWREEFIDEAMTSKDFKYLYGLSIYDLQINSVLGSTQHQSTQAQDIVHASADATDYAFGPEFPGSFVNVIGDPVTSELSPNEMPDSTSKVDTQARISPGDTDSETKKDWGGDQDGAVLPSDPWNYNPTPIVADGEDYEQIIRARFTSDDSPQIKVYSINLSANQTYTFKVLDHVNGESIPGLTWNGYGWDEPGYNANFNTDSVLSLQDANGNVVAQNDDLFPGTYNQYVASNPGDTYPEGPGGEPEYYDGFGWTSAPINYNTTEVPGDESEWYYILNSNISFTPTQSGTYYLAVRDYFNSTAGWNDGPVPTSNYYKIVVRGAAPAGSQGGPPTEKPGGSTQDTTDAWDLGGPVAAFLANPESKDKLKSKTLGPSDFKSAADYEAFKAGGGNAALQQGKTLSQVIIQGKINLGKNDPSFLDNLTKWLQTLGMVAIPLLGSLNNELKAMSNMNQIVGIIQKYLGKEYSLSEWKPSNEGAKALVLKNGKPVMGEDGRPYSVSANGVSSSGKFTKSKGQQTTGNNVRNIVNRIKSSSGGGGGASAFSPVAPIEPWQPFKDPLSGSKWDPTSNTYIANSYQPRGWVFLENKKSITRKIRKSSEIKTTTPRYDKVKKFVSNNKTQKMKTFQQFTQNYGNFEYEGKPSPNGFPDQLPPETINGWHPEYGKRGKMYNTLDKMSALSMPLTGNPDIDEKILKARKRPK